MKCRDCKWCWLFENDETQGYCHRNPPLMFATAFPQFRMKKPETGERGVWPVIKARHWCGEFKQEQVPSKAEAKE